MISVYRFLVRFSHFTKITYYTVKRGFILRQWFPFANVEAALKDLLQGAGLVQHMLDGHTGSRIAFFLDALEGVLAPWITC